ncbi:hypothetical protein CLV58_10343 [Spirosoma oryzae]|uniref:Uncharacterized protein n=1 Tax=Spirosoma oryzae TaxID=1469603 RepID=A0A2T0TEM2_9BACT|nr:hypothetical protein [Spirosoma oryzae]PRY44074.1 hypothetical protein CLV58_10343 [Spirosoma oryzae]
MRRLLLACLPVLLWACQPKKTTEQSSGRSDVDSVQAKMESVNDFRIVPGLRVGPVRYSTSEAELLRLLGPAVVTVGDSIDGAEGDVLIGTTLYKNTADQLQILYQDSAQRQHPELVLIRPYVTDADGNPLPDVKPTRWSTADGVRIGMPLKELEQCNGKPFRLWGFGWDYGGSVSSWQGGRFDMGAQTMLSVTLAPPSTLSPAQTRALDTVSGDGEFMSSNQAMQLLSPVVQTMQVTLKP